MDIDELFMRYYRPLCLYASHFLPTLDACEEIVQGTFIAFWEKVQAGEAPIHPKPYLYATVRNRCLNAVRRQQLAGVDIMDIDLDGLSAEEAAEQSQDEAEIWEAIDKLPSRRREILLMNIRDGIPTHEIAECFGISERTVRNQLYRALGALRRGTGAPTRKR